ncbi:UvrD-helicase domain-containing protein [Paenibacillus sp. 37]|uniref:UvrD-helicase domain-containing protein n=1 Tax=Paenibacillus sp. 37 TaxID=2607911 RepID=UPI00122E754A|nr:UvrD-helicase domain-containing protein [Paenibacillus sp. 37]
MILRGGISLSQEQAAIVDSVMGAKPITVVSAGAGSGKTRTMVASVLHLVKEEKVNIDDFALITFTNKATDEMRERLESGVQDRIRDAENEGDWEERTHWFEQKERIASTFIGTIHRFCSMLLQNFGYTELIPHETEILMARHHFQRALKETLDESLSDTATSILFNSDNVKWAPHVMNEHLEQWYEYIRGRGRSIKVVVQETLNQKEDDEEQDHRNAVAHLLNKLDDKYRAIKQELGGVDSNDLLHKSAELVKRYEHQISPLVASRFRYLFVDEFQDTDELQMSIIQSLSPNLKHVLVVGDRKQAIYGFRGADHSVLQKIADLNNTKPLSLSASRRPTALLHKAQEALFDDMGLRYDFLKEKLNQAEDAHVPKDSLIPFQYEHIDVFKDREQPIFERVLQKIKDFLGQSIHDRHTGNRTVEYRDICVLFRSNYQLNRYLAKFPSDIPVINDTGGSFFKKPEIIACYYMLQAILKYPDDVSLDLALGTPFLPFVAPNSIYKSDGTNQVLRDWFEEEEECKSWLLGIAELRKRIKVDLVPQLLTYMYEFTRVREYYGKQGNSQAVANLEKLVMWSRELMDAEAQTLQQFFDRFQTALLSGMNMDEADTGEEDAKPNAIRFSTVHSAKGLEYPIVIIPDVGRRLLPNDKLPTFHEREGWGIDLILPGEHGRSSKFKEWEEQHRQDFLEEEARILYVAVTRAEHVVCMIGNGSRKVNTPDSENWSWKDEILTAGPALAKLGTHIVKID